MAKAPQKEPEIEIDPEKAKQFGEFIKQIAKAGPHHRTKKENGVDSKEPNRPRRTRSEGSSR
jgi:hypothetical protein